MVKKWFNAGIFREKWFNMWFNRQCSCGAKGLLHALDDSLIGWVVVESCLCWNLTYERKL